MSNSERFKEFGLKFLVAFSFNVFAIQPNFVIKGVAPRFNFFIISLLLKLLSMVKVLLANSDQIL